MASPWLALLGAPTNRPYGSMSLGLSIPTRHIPLVRAIALCPWREPDRRSIVSASRSSSARAMQAMPNGQTLRSGRVTGMDEYTVSHGSTGLGQPSGPGQNSVFHPEACSTTSPSSMESYLFTTGGQWAPSGASAGLPTPLAPSFSSPMPTGVPATNVCAQQGGSQPTTLASDTTANILLNWPLLPSAGLGSSPFAPRSASTHPASTPTPAPATVPPPTHTASDAGPPEDILQAMELVRRWRVEHPRAGDALDVSSEAGGAGALEAPSLPLLLPPTPLVIDPNLCYTTVSIKSAQIDTIAKLNVGKGESHLNWWFDFSGQLEALNLDKVSRSGLTSTNPRHVCGPIAVRDLHGVCKSAIKHNESLMRMARSSFPSTSSGTAFLSHLYNTYVAPHLLRSDSAEEEVFSFDFSHLGSAEATFESATDLMETFWEPISRLSHGRRGSLSFWIEFFSKRCPADVHMELRSLYPNLAFASAHPSEVTLAVATAVGKVAERRKLTSPPGPPSTYALAVARWQPTRRRPRGGLWQRRRPLVWLQAKRLQAQELPSSQGQQRALRYLRLDSGTCFQARRLLWETRRLVSQEGQPSSDCRAQAVW